MPHVWIASPEGYACLGVRRRQDQQTPAWSAGPDVIRPAPKPESRRNRLVCWFSCGATSAVAAKLALEVFPDLEPHVVYHDTRSEHPDNKRFLADCEEWLGLDIEQNSSMKYRDIWDVFKRERGIVGVKGAKCTGVLKREPARLYAREGDVQVFGFDRSENFRLRRFRHNNPEIHIEAPLIDAGYSKARCLEVLASAGIELPMMYRLGYRNNNCIGCPKGGQGYWNMIRCDFPEVFERMAKLERELNVAINKSYAGDGKRKRVFLDELDPAAGRGFIEPMDCGLFCQETAE